jgi:hypothetical protein
VQVDDDEISFNGRPWDPGDQPDRHRVAARVRQPQAQRTGGKFRDNIHRGERDPNLIKDAALSTVPSTLFVLLPVFALMLKFAYAFKRRLYMEHLIVALHSHAFLCLALLAMFLTMACAGRGRAAPARAVQGGGNGPLDLDARLPPADAEACLRSRLDVDAA